MEAEASADTGESVEESVPEEEVSGEAASEEESVPKRSRLLTPPRDE